jgi:hypothetical protein
MRPKRFEYTMTAADDDGYLLSATGAGPWVTFLAQPGDMCSHQVSINTSDDLSGITFTLLGTDAENRSITEGLVGGNNAKVYSVKFYKTLVSITASSTVGALHYDAGWIGGGKSEYVYTPTYPVAIYPDAGPELALDLTSGTIEYTKQQTNDNVYDNNPASWQTLGTADLTVDSKTQALVGTTGVRVKLSAYTSAIFYLTVSQARV